ncbi:MAG: hypothetical protein AMXMBFR82_20420 [Candidatus Hydrogenedentota bacterium]
MHPIEYCTECQATIPPYAPGGLCLRCMIQHGLDETVSAPRDTTRNAPTEDCTNHSVLTPGTYLGAFCIAGHLGAGGQGSVYRAYDSKLGRYVALKILRADLLSEPECLARFEREARTLASLNHPKIAALYELREEGQHRFLVLELVEGQTLSERLADGRFQMAEVLDIGIQIAEALEAAHKRGVIHRDLKPSNIMLTPEGDVKVLDFGIAKAMDAGLHDFHRYTQTRIDLQEAFTNGRIVGTPAYMSPEQRNGDAVDNRTDIWTFGLILYEMLIGNRGARDQQGRPLPASSNIETVPATLRMPPELHPSLQQVLSRALQSNVSERYQSITEVLAELRGVADRLDAGQLQNTNVQKKLPSLAILPFVNVDDDPANQYFSDGLADELIYRLGKLPGLRVVARSSSFRFREADYDVREIGSQLGVSSVLEGSVRRAKNRLRLTVNLVSTADGYHRWSGRYDRELEDMFGVQEEIAVAIVENLKYRLREEDVSSITTRYTDSLEAHDHYLKGRYHLNSVSLERLNTALECFRKAIREDPQYALAYAGLTECYCLLGMFGFIDPKEAIPNAMKAGSRAIALDESLAEVHHAMGLVRTFCNEWASAREEFKRAIQLQPEHAFGRACYAMYLRFTTDATSALDAMRIALDLEPHSVAVNAGAAYLFYSLRQYDEAIRQCEKVLAMEPDFFQAHGYLAFSYARKGMLNRSVAEWQALLEQRGYRVIAAGVQRAYARSGYRGAMLAIARRGVLAYYVLRILRWVSRKCRRFCTPMLPAVLYAEAGERDRALAWLNKAHKQRSPLMIGLTEDPTWDGLRSDPRFDEVIGKIASNPIE